MPRRASWVIALVSTLFCGPVFGHAAIPVFIDFEIFPGPDGLLRTPDDIPAPPCPGGICGNLSSEYAGLGLVFNSGTLGQGDLTFPGSGPANHYVTSSPLDVTLSRNVLSVTVDSYSVWPAVLRAYDAGGALIGSSTLAHPQPGQSFALGTLTLTSTTPIRRFTVRPQACAPEGSCNAILNLDKLRLRLEAPEPPAGDWLVSEEVPGFRFKVQLTNPLGNVVPSHQEPACIAETLCVSGAIAGRPEVLVRIVGPRPNGYLWPTLVKFTPSRAEVWIEQSSTGLLNYYDLPPTPAGDDTLPGLFDRFGFVP